MIGKEWERALMPDKPPDDYFCDDFMPSVLAKEAENLPPVHGQVHMVVGGDGAEALRDTPELYGRGRGSLRHGGLLSKCAKLVE